MAKYIAKRVALAIVTLLVLTSVVFVLVRLMPGDPFSSDKMTPEIKANLEAYYGLDKPLAEQYITYMKNVLHGDLGYSMKYESQTVNRIIADSFPYSADWNPFTVLCIVLRTDPWNCSSTESRKETGLRLYFDCDHWYIDS